MSHENDSLPTKRAALPHLVMFTALLGLPTWFGHRGSATEMAAAVLPGTLGLIFLNLDRFKSFKAPGIEAELKDAVQTAYATVNQMKQVARTLLLAQADAIAASGRMSLLTMGEKLNRLQELDTLATDLELERNADWIASKERIFSLFEMDHIDLMSRKVGKNTREKLNSLRSSPPHPDVLWALVDTLDAKERALVEPFVEMYEHFRCNRRLLDPNPKED